MPDGEGSAAKSPLTFRLFKLQATADSKSHFKVRHKLPALHALVGPCKCCRAYRRQSTVRFAHGYPACHIGFRVYGGGSTVFEPMHSKVLRTHTFLSAPAQALCNPELLLQHYTPRAVFSELAQRDLVLPDKAALPSVIR